MVSLHKTAVIIPAYNEEQSIGRVVNDIPRDLVSKVIVVDNGSSDETARRAIESGAEVISEPRRGYGNACLAGLDNLPEETNTVVFMDGDYSDYPGEIRDLLKALGEQKADLVIGSRVLGHPEMGSLTLQQRFGNWFSTQVIHWVFGFAYTDLGPFRAIRREALNQIQMQDRNFGWTVEMQIKALQHGLKVVEIPVSYRKRIGKSKVSGTVAGTIKAGVKILWTIGKLIMQNPSPRGQ